MIALCSKSKESSDSGWQIESATFSTYPPSHCCSAFLLISHSLCRGISRRTRPPRKSLFLGARKKSARLWVMKLPQGVQRSEKWFVRGWVKFVSAFAWLLWLALPGSFLTSFTNFFHPSVVWDKGHPSLIIEQNQDWFALMLEHPSKVKNFYGNATKHCECNNTTN